MKTFLPFFIIALLTLVINLQAQSGSNVNYHSSLPHIYFIRTVSNPGKIPSAFIQVIDKEGRSISCKTDDPKKQSANQLSVTDSLMNSLETCTDCKIVKTTAQMAAIFKTIVLINPKCSVDTGLAVYGRNHEEGKLYFIQIITRGCGKTDSANKLLDSLISQFEKPGDESLLKELNNGFVAKQNKAVSNETDLDFVPEVNEASARTFGISARISTDGMLRLVSKIPLTRVKVVFFPSKTFGRITHYPGIFFLTKKPGSDLYDLDLNEEEYKKMAKLIIIPMMVTGDKAEITLINKNVPVTVVPNSGTLNWLQGRPDAVMQEAKRGGYSEYFKPQSFSCEVWVGANQILYCKTDAPIYDEATIQFTVPAEDDHHSPHWSKATAPLKIYLIKPAGSDTYQYDLSKENLRKIQRISLKLSGRFFTTEVLLPNEKVKIYK